MMTLAALRTSSLARGRLRRPRGGLCWLARVAGVPVPPVGPPPQEQRSNGTRLSAAPAMSVAAAKAASRSGETGF